MSKHEQSADTDVVDLSKRYTAMCVDEWARRFRLPPNALALAMLAHAVNLLIEDGGADEAAAILAGVAAAISTTEVAGHA